MITLYGPPEFRSVAAAAWKAAAANVEACAARADIENQKASAPCGACGRLMPAAERCGACRANGVWFCASCHARFEGLELGT